MYYFNLLTISVYFSITVIIGICLLSGKYRYLINNVENIIKNIDCCNEISECGNTIMERFLFWIYLINSGYLYVRSCTDTKSSEFINLLFMNVGGIPIFFIAINPTFCRRYDKNDIILLLLYIITYTVSLHFSVLDTGFLKNIVFTYDHIKLWNAVTWIIVVTIGMLICFWLFIQFIHFYLKSYYVFSFYFFIFVCSTITLIFTTLIFTEINDNNIHMHHYFVGTFLIMYSASFHDNSDTYNEYFVRVTSTFVQSMLLGMIIDGITNYGIDALYAS